MFVSRREFEKFQEKFDKLNNDFIELKTSIKLKEEQEKDKKGSYSLLGVPQDQKKYIEDNIAKAIKKEVK